MIVKQAFRFEAAHMLPRHPGKCRNLHGHSYRFVLSLERPVDPSTGMTIDFDDIVGLVRTHVLDLWDHKSLNDFMANPTAENIAVDLWGKLEGKLPGLAEIELWEIPESSVVYRGERDSKGTR